VAAGGTGISGGARLNVSRNARSLYRNNAKV